MGPNITLTAFDGLVMFGPLLSLLVVMMIGFATYSGDDV
ncbi:hypothetical protein UFOVP247_153 [uncultured Caudovirales phage]|uniref:Uncharacterized protein n=1 Tax=uncultured Caudovirales phage TaxID=2100421 RepID=A0A6J7WX15_9CAUD|nr:hypothetical protein UFOVP247_153 [uncultured Caudovirales phage]